MCVPLVNPRFKREFIDAPAKNRPGAITRSDLQLSNQGDLVTLYLTEYFNTFSELGMINVQV